MHQNSSGVNRTTLKFRIQFKIKITEFMKINTINEKQGKNTNKNHFHISFQF